MKNRGVASPLKVWFTTVWATLVTGLPEVGVMPESARQAGLHTRYTPCSKKILHMSHTSQQLTRFQFTKFRTRCKRLLIACMPGCTNCKAEPPGAIRLPLLAKATRM